jgi:hypothetical protein
MSRARNDRTPNLNHNEATHVLSEKRKRLVNKLRREMKRRVEQLEHDHTIRLMALFNEYHVRRSAIIRGAPAKPRVSTFIGRVHS